MKKSELKALIREVLDVYKEDNVNNRTIEEANGDASITARIDNNVYPMSSEELEKLADESNVGIFFLGDSTFGTSTLPSYKVKLTAPQGQLDAFVDRLAEDSGIEFYDDNDSKSKCVSCGREFVPAYGEHSRCPSCLNRQHSAGEKATGVQEYNEKNVDSSEE